MFRLVSAYWAQPLRYITPIILSDKTTKPSLPDAGPGRPSAFKNCSMRLSGTEIWLDLCDCFARSRSSEGTIIVITPSFVKPPLPPLMAPYRAILRCHRCDTPCRAILFQGGRQSPKMVRYPPCYLVSHRHISATPHKTSTNSLRDTIATSIARYEKSRCWASLPPPPLQGLLRGGVVGCVRVGTVHIAMVVDWKGPKGSEGICISMYVPFGSL